MARGLNEGLKQAREQYLDTKKVSEPVFQRFIMADPSTSKKYVEWLCKMYLQDHDLIGRLDAVKKFDEMVNKNIIGGQDKDIYRYDTFEKLADIVMRHEEVKTKTQQKKDTLSVEVKMGDRMVKPAELVFENDKCKIYKINTKEASCILGANTKWCTASGSSFNYFEDYYYDRLVNLYYILPKDLLLETYGKIAAAVHQKGRTEYYNQVDKSLSEKEAKTIMDALGVEMP